MESSFVIIISKLNGNNAVTDCLLFRYYRANVMTIHVKPLESHHGMVPLESRIPWDRSCIAAVNIKVSKTNKSHPHKLEKQETLIPERKQANKQIHTNRNRDKKGHVVCKKQYSCLLHFYFQINQTQDHETALRWSIHVAMNITMKIHESICAEKNT